VLEVRAGRREDLPALTEIYNHYVISSAATFDLVPFSVEDRGGWFAHYSDTGPHRLLVAVDGEQVCGYATSSRFREKAAYDPSVETTVYCRDESTRRGVGTALYSALFAALRGENVHRAYAGIAQPNEASMALHRRFGFEVVGTFGEVGRKFDAWWDVTWLQAAP
jgi:phosphinothricin acetyltransferase